MKSKTLLGILAAFFMAASALVADISINVTPSLGPNAFGSPNYADWQNNAITGLMTGATTVGGPGPAQYNALANGTILSPEQNFVTSFNSWAGEANPAAPYDNEYGQRLLFGLTVLGDNASDLFSISQLAFMAVSTDPWNSLGFSFALGSYNYSAGYVGVLYGGDGVFGGGDDSYVTAGPNTQLVNGLIGRGSGNAWWPTNEADIDTLKAQLEAVGPFDFTGTYTLDTQGGPVVGGGYVTFNQAANVSDTGMTITLLGAAFAGMAAVGRRKQMLRVCS